MSNHTNITDSQLQALADDPFFGLILMSGAWGRVTSATTGEVVAEAWGGVS